MPWAWFLYRYTDTDIFKKAHLSRAHNLPSIPLTDHRFSDIMFAALTVETKRYLSRTETRHSLCCRSLVSDALHLQHLEPESIVHLTITI